MTFSRQIGAGDHEKGQRPFLVLWLVTVMAVAPCLQAQAVPQSTTPQSATPQSTRPMPTTPMPMAPTAAAPPLPAATVAKPSIAGTDAPPTTVVPPVLPEMPVAPGAEVDRVVAIINGDLILDSDVDQERRFAALLPYGEAAGAYNRDAAIERLVNRDLILQQVKLQPQEAITNADAAKDLETLRKALPTCKQYHCETKEGWDRFLATQGFDEATLDELWRKRMVVLAFIEQRFRMGIKITPQEIQTYFDQTLRPQYAAQHATPPPLASISARIQEILLQQRVTGLLTDWLQSLRAQGSVVLLHPGEEAP
jgi:peptidyl-prolyl cis-trans isomerase SurA